MGLLKITANPDPQGPPLKIESRGNPPAPDGVHYADEFSLRLDPWIQLEPLQQRKIEPPPANAPAAPPAAPAAPAESAAPAAPAAAETPAAPASPAAAAPPAPTTPNPEKAAAPAGPQ